ncbi:LmbU family transcriptional regulator [Streptomyces echinatus]|uniref:LmbU family transcriptional regulator n=1 Tax=Streptomyces echinatus TaxID=67293 RepID=UPI0037B1B2E1
MDALAGRTGLRLPEGLSLDSWCELGGRILTVSDSSAWWIGDWLVFGQEQYANRYRQAMKQTSLDYQTLRNYAWIARKFKPSRRREELTFQHHVEVAALPWVEQDHWLDFAVRFKWSRNELRRQIKASESSEVEGVDVREVQVHLRMDEVRVRSWQDTADQSNRSLEDWMAHVLEITPCRMH